MSTIRIIIYIAIKCISVFLCLHKASPFLCVRSKIFPLSLRYCLYISRYLILGLSSCPLPVRGLHSVVFCIHRSLYLLITCSAHCHFYFTLVLDISMILVLFRVSPMGFLYLRLIKCQLVSVNVLVSEPEPFND